MNQGFSKFLKSTLIVIAGLWVYSPVFHGAWIWDDSVEIIQNSAIKTSFNGLVSIWTSPKGADYFPLKTSVQWLEWHCFGNDPLGYHLLSIVLHITCALLLWKIISKLDNAYGWLAGLIFVIHPVAVDSVAWVSELKNTLSLPLLLLAWCSFIDEDAQAKRHIRSFVYFSLALLAKSSVVIFPITALLYLYWKHGKLDLKKILNLSPLFIASAIVGLIAIYFQHTRAIAGGELQIGTCFERTLASPMSLMFYIKQAFLPLHVSPIYPRWSLDLLSPRFLSSWLCLIALSLVCFRFKGVLGRGFFFLILFFILNLVPALGIIPMSYLRYSWVSDHFAYISLIAMATLAAGLWIETLAYIKQKSKYAPIIMIWLGFGVLGYFASISHVQAARYAVPETFWAYNLDQNPDSWVVQYNYAEVIANDSNRHLEAIEHYKASIKLNPSDPEAHNNLGILLGEIPDQRAQALNEFAEALKILPSYAEAHNDLAALLSQDPTQIDTSIEQYQLALALKPNLSQAHNNIANLYKKQNRFSEALEHYQTALSLNPNYAEAENNWANMLVQEGGHDDEAILHYQAAAKLAPNAATIHFNLGLLLERTAGRQNDAVHEFEIVLKIIPNYQPAIEQIDRLKR